MGRENIPVLPALFLAQIWSVLITVKEIHSIPARTSTVMMWKHMNAVYFPLVLTTKLPAKHLYWCSAFFQCVKGWQYSLWEPAPSPQAGCSLPMSACLAGCAPMSAGLIQVCFHMCPHWECILSLITHFTWGTKLWQPTLLLAPPNNYLLLF